MWVSKFWVLEWPTGEVELPCAAHGQGEVQPFHLRLPCNLLATDCGGKG